PSLARLDRRIPILASALMSSAATRLLDEMGFTVRAAVAGESMPLGDLALTFFAPDHVAHSTGDEWDVLPFLVEDRAGAGSFLSFVDVPPPADLVDRLKTRRTRPGIVCYANNAVDLGAQIGGRVSERTDEVAAGLVAFIGEQSRRFEAAWATPAATVLTGGGFAYDGERSWMNRSAFPA